VNTESLRGHLHVGEESLHASLGLLWQDYSTSAYILKKKNAAMPTILNYTPPWLTRPSRGSKIFTDTTSHGSKPSTSFRASQSGSPNGITPNESHQGPRRLLAKRGTEIFAVVNNKIRWADLARVKSDWEDQAGAQSAQGSPRPAQRQNGDSGPFRVCHSRPSGTTD
jgi:hypothetical protein